MDRDRKESCVEREVKRGIDVSPSKAKGRGFVRYAYIFGITGV